MPGSNYLIDTNIISLLAPSRSARPTAILHWLERASDRLSISVVTVAEVRDGIAKAARGGATRKASELRSWWDAVEHLYADRILPFDLTAARIAGDLMDRARHAGRTPGFADLAIAATALSRNLTVVTQNTQDFEPWCESLLNPFDDVPPF